MGGGIRLEKGKRGFVHVYRDGGIWIEHCLYVWSFGVFVGLVVY